jgi:hypothetical protein
VVSYRACTVMDTRGDASIIDFFNTGHFIAFYFFYF